MGSVRGIDVSAWKAGLDLSAIKSAGYDFAILRGGRTGYGEGRVKGKDDCFERFYADAKKNKIPVGCFWYSCADSATLGQSEAEFFYENCLKGKQFEYPIYIDVEEPRWQSNKKKGVTDAIIAFCDYLEKKGYFVGVYASLSWFNYHIDTARLSAYSKWVACWTATKPSFNYNGFDMWQDSNSGRVMGIRVDTNYAYKDFPTIIKRAGLNGFKSGTKPTPAPEPAKKTIDELAEEVIAGKWGNGEERVKRLTEAGYDYNAVQKRVNEIVYGGDIQVGDKVKVINPINYDNGKKFNLYYKTYEVMELKGDRAVIGVNGVVTSAINVKYLEKV